MAAFEIYDYVDTVTANVDVTLTLEARGSVHNIGKKNQVVHLGDDGSEKIVNLDDDSIFHIVFPYSALTESDAGTIFDLYNDKDKANGIASSFKYDSDDGHTYVVRFRMDLDREKFLGGNMGYGEIRLKVLGRIDD